MCRTHHNLYTKDQLQMLLRSWQCDEPIPRPGQKVVIAWPGAAALDVDLVEVEPTGLSATYGGKLFRVTQSSRAGREFDQQVQEAHVIVFRRHLVEARRQENLARRTVAEQLMAEVGDKALEVTRRASCRP